MATAETKTAVSGVLTNIGTESVVAVSDIISYAAPAGEGLIVRGMMNITAGTGTTAVVVRVRRGNGLAGVVVGISATHTLAAGATASIPFEALDQPPISVPISTPAGAQTTPSNQYTLTVVQTGGTATGTVNYATIGIMSAANVG